MIALSHSERITNPYTYEDYKNLVITLAENSGSTGEQNEERVAATKINAQRIKRIDKQCELDLNLLNAIQNFKPNCLWVLIVESWCGDGAQNAPVIAKIAGQSQNIELKLILRDENIPFMDSYLTNGSRSVPKLICIDKDTNQEIGTWGPRPKLIQNMVLDYKRNNPTATHEEFVTNLHLWYAKDKTNAIQNEFLDLLKTWNAPL